MTDATSLEERRNQCRAQAKEAEQLADEASPEMRAAYLRLAQAWLQLASEIEREINSRPAKSAPGKIDGRQSRSSQ